MAAINVLPHREKINDLWALAAAELSDEDKQAINFNRPDKLNILAELHAEADQCRQRSLKSRWKFTRSSGETVIIRDLFEKIVRWIDTFKQIGDIAVQYDPTHASLPWACVRIVLQVAVNDSEKYARVIEGLAQVTEIIYRYAIIEALYLQKVSNVTEELKQAIVKLYAKVLGYITRAKRYLEQQTAHRIIKSAFLSETELDMGLGAIRPLEDNVRQYISLVDTDQTFSHHNDLRKRLSEIDTPLRRMDERLKAIKDNLNWRILTWLSSEPYLKHHKQITKGVLKDTGQWLLSDPVFKNWRNESASSILWLHGIPGSGKSNLVSIIIEESLKNFKTGHDPQPIYFYCSRNPSEPTRSDPAAILASLARQLSCLEPGKPLLGPTIDLFREKEIEGFASGSIEIDESCALLLDLIEQYPLVTIFIDAMDECDPRKRLHLLKFLETILQDSSSLVKIFISSRSDQDIVWRLKHYPNMEIDSQRNSNDIARFVRFQTEQLVRDGELLQYSNSPTHMKELIVEKLTEGATGMFRWASLQLQFLCQLDMDVDIKYKVGRIPPDLRTLYEDIFNIVSKRPGDAQSILFQNTLHWLLYAKNQLSEKEFLYAITIHPQLYKEEVSASRDVVLKICNNFVVFDKELGTFRFAHLSVREFLEQKPEFCSQKSNALLAQTCLWIVISIEQSTDTKEVLLQAGWDSKTLPVRSKRLSDYADKYWIDHCITAGDERRAGTLSSTLKYVLSDKDKPCSIISQWALRGCYGLSIHERYYPGKLTLPDPFLPPGLYLAIALDFKEQIEDADRAILLQKYFEIGPKELLRHVIRNGSYLTMMFLLDQTQPILQISERTLMGVISHRSRSVEMMQLLLDRKGSSLQITQSVLVTAAKNHQNGYELMSLLLDQRGLDFQITDEVLIAAIENDQNSCKIIELILDRRGTDVKITKEVLIAATRNDSSGYKLIVLLLDRRGSDIVITKEVLIAAMEQDYPIGYELVVLFLNRRGTDFQISEGLLWAAAHARRGDKYVELFLDRRGEEEVMITEDILIAAASNTYGAGKEVIKVLLARRGSEFWITEDVLASAAANSSQGSDIVEMFMKQRRSDFCVTERLVQAASMNENKGDGIRTIGLLYDEGEVVASMTKEEALGRVWTLINGRTR